MMILVLQLFCDISLGPMNTLTMVNVTVSGLKMRIHQN